MTTETERLRHDRLNRPDYGQRRQAARVEAAFERVLKEAQMLQHRFQATGMHLRRKSAPVTLELKAKSNGEIEGYGSVFGNEDSYGDVVEPGAFAKSLREHQAKGT